MSGTPAHGPEAPEQPAHGSGPTTVPGFEGSYLGKRDLLQPGSRLECKICWWVYDPTQGDAQWQIPPGTAFADLPAHWRCPQCDADAEQFMVLTP